jgi:hypothetical protein
MTAVTTSSIFTITISIWCRKAGMRADVVRIGCADEMNMVSSVRWCGRAEA